MDDLLRIARPLLERQHSLITRKQVLEAGVSPAALRRVLERGIWELVDVGCYGPTGVALSWRRRLMRAVLCGPDGTVASHRSAAALRGIGGLEDPPIEITIPRGTTFRRADVVTHESCDLALAGNAMVDGIPTTDLRRLAMDLGSVVSFERFKHTIREMRHGHGVTSEQLLSTYLAHKRQGRNGGGALRDWIDRYFDVKGVSESGLELLVLDALLDCGFTRPVRQFWVTTDIGRFRLDLAFPDWLVCIEVDGSQHEDVDVTRADRRRTEALRALGWTVLRVRSKHVASDLAKVVRVLRALTAESVVDR